MLINVWWDTKGNSCWTRARDSVVPSHCCLSKQSSISLYSECFIPCKSKYTVSSANFVGCVQRVLYHDMLSSSVFKTTFASCVCFALLALCVLSWASAMSPSASCILTSRASPRFTTSPSRWAASWFSTSRCFKDACCDVRTLTRIHINSYHRLT